MRIALLGPLEVGDDRGGSVEIAGVRLRTLLARLALEPGRLVTTEGLIDAVWGEEPPAGAVNALQSLVSRLRRVLAVPAVESLPAGYRLALPGLSVDVDLFERHTRLARVAWDGGDLATAALRLDEALRLWRGVPLADVDGGRFASATVARLMEAHLRAVEDRAELRLALGAGGEVVAQLGELVAAHPLRERTRALQMRALHAAGRSAEALSSFAELREGLADALGADPSAAVRDVHTAILRGDGDRPGAGGNLRVALTSFVGREEDCERVGAALDGARLVTLVGPGGAGKTRLAVEVAAGRVRHGRAVDGAWFVELAGVPDAGEVPAAILAALGVRDSAFLGTGSGGSVGRLVEALRDRPALLILDNCEHVLAACAEVADAILGGCPQVRILATTREPLAITGEVLHAVGPLAVPPATVDIKEAMDSPSLRLLVDRARAVRPGFAVTPENLASTVEVCRRLDGLPLAIELACARLRTLPLDDLAARLGDRFRLLTGGSRTAMPRHQTLLAVVGWSWDLFSDAERTLARRLAAFAGGATVDSAEAVCAGQGVSRDQVFDLLCALVDKSFVQVQEVRGADSRYRMLDTVRAYAAGALAEAGEADEVRRAHAHFFRDWAELAEPRLRGQEQLAWLDWYEREYDNLTTALRWAIDFRDADTAVRLAVALGWFGLLRGVQKEVGAWLAEALSLVDDPGTCGVGVDALATAYAYDAIHQFSANEPERATRSAEVARSLVDGGVASHPAVVFAIAVVQLGQFDLASVFAGLAGLADHPDPWVAAAGRLVRGHGAETLGDVMGAGELFAQARAAFAAAGDRWGTMMALSCYAGSLSLAGDHASAIAALDEAAELAMAVGAEDDALWTRGRRGLELLRSGDLAGARTDLEACHARSAARRSPAMWAAGEGGLAELARMTGDLAGARSLLTGASDRVAGLAGSVPTRVRIVLLTGLGRVDTAEGDPRTARVRLADALGKALAVGDLPMIAAVAEALADAYRAGGDAAGAARLLGLAAAARGGPDEGSPDVRATAAALRVALGDEAYESTYALAARLPHSEAVAALSNLPHPARP